MEKDQSGKKASNPWGKPSGVRSLSEDDWPLPSLPLPGEKKRGQKVNTATAGSSRAPQNADSNEVSRQVSEAATDNIITSARSDSEQVLAELDLQQQNSFMINSMEQSSDLQSEACSDQNREIISSAAEEIGGGEPISSHHNRTEASDEANTEATSGYQVSVEVAQSILNPRSDFQHLSFFSGSMYQSSALQSDQNISSAAQEPNEEENLGGTVIAQIWSWVDLYPQRRW